MQDWDPPLTSIPAPPRSFWNPHGSTVIQTPSFGGLIAAQSYSSPAFNLVSSHPPSTPKPKGCSYNTAQLDQVPPLHKFSPAPQSPQEEAHHTERPCLVCLRWPQPPHYSFFTILSPGPVTPYYPPFTFKSNQLVPTSEPSLLRFSLLFLPWVVLLLLQGFPSLESPPLCIRN